MSKVRLNSAEAARIQEVADRFAKRTNRRFVLDQDRVEVVDESGNDAAKEEAKAEESDKPATLDLR
jgi:hypothetical protein